MQTDMDAHSHPQKKHGSVLKQRFLETVGQLLQKLLQDWALLLLIIISGSTALRGP
jgi:hypothetical protein